MLVTQGADAARGFSAGGEVLLHLATQHPERIGGMALVGTSHEVPEAVAMALREFPAFEDNPPELRDYWLRIHPGGEKTARQIRRGP